MSKGEVTNKRMSQSSLEAFSKTQKLSTVEKPAAEPQLKTKTVQPIQAPAEQEKLATVNIKITRSQQEWLADTARLVRDNNDEPVPPADRVYPQHLIQAAIDLLKAAEIDWGQVRSLDDVKAQLNL
jgi:hypothetical protein